MKVTPEQYWEVESGIISRLSKLDLFHKFPELTIIMQESFRPPAGYFNREELEEYLALMDGYTAEMTVELNVLREKLEKLKNQQEG